MTLGAQIGPNWADPATYTLDADGCWLWNHATANGNPLVHRNGRRQLVRRIMAPDVRANQHIEMSCGKKTCINPAHFAVKDLGFTYVEGRATGRGMLDAKGMPKPTSFTVDENGCHNWIGHVHPAAGPIATYRGQAVRLRALILNLRQGEHIYIKAFCKNPACINPAHLYLPRVHAETRQQLFRENRLHVNMTRGPTELRDLRWIRDDLRRLLDLDPTNGSKLTLNARWAVEHYANGYTLGDLAKVADVTRQALSQQIKLADRRLRKYAAQTPLQ